MLLKDQKIIVSDFANDRHFSRGRPFSFCDMSRQELVWRVKHDSDLYKPGYRAGVILVPLLDVTKIYTPVVKITEENKHLCRVEFGTRQPGELPRKKVVIDCPKSPAKFVDVVLYRKDVLAETGEGTPMGDWSDQQFADWEVISVNARIDPVEPMSVGAMARNMAGLPGGTKGTYTAEEFMNAINYWADKAMATG